MAIMECPFCKSSSFVKFVLPKGNFKVDVSRLTIYECEKCTLLFKNISIMKDDLIDYYSSNNNEYTSKVQKNVREYRFFKNLIEKNVTSGNVLDIGCNDGSFVASLSEQYKVYGVEPSKVKPVSNSITMYNKFFEEVDFKSQKFNVITLFDVFEHIFDIVNFVNKLDDIAKPGTMILITTPDSDSFTHRVFGRFWRHYVPFEHILFYNKKLMSDIFSRKGFNLIDSKSYDHKLNPPVSFLKLMLSVFKMPAKMIFNLFATNKKKVFAEMFNDYRYYLFIKNN